jgi:hypothetical protein
VSPLTFFKLCLTTHLIQNISLNIQNYKSWFNFFSGNMNHNKYMIFFIKILIRQMVKHNKKVNDDDNLKMKGVIQQTPRPKLNISVNTYP